MRVLVATETLSEGFNISGADIVVNFDIPYNPVRLIQRIGRATRLDVPKLVQVKNFRPSEEIDREIDLVDRLQIRIEDIIRFVGLDYRIWFERESLLLRERRKFDSEIYKRISEQILKGVRSDYWKGKFDKLEIAIQYSDPIVALMQKAIVRYAITKVQVQSKKLLGNSYTLLRGKKNLSIFYGTSKTFNSDALNGLEIEEVDMTRSLESAFAEEIADFKKRLATEKQQLAMLSYYSDRTDKLIRGIRDRLVTQKYLELYPSATELSNQLLLAKDISGDRTASVIREIHKALKKGLTNKTIVNFSLKLKDSFRVTSVQKPLEIEEEPYLALGQLE